MKYNQELYVKYPCGLELRMIQKFRTFMAEGEFKQSGMDISECPIHGNYCPNGKPSSEGFEGQATGLSKAEKPGDEGF